MSDSSLRDDYIRTRQRVDLLERVEKVAAVYATLTRTTTFTIGTTETLVPWESEVRSIGGITWSGSAITLPVAGYYHIDMTFYYSAAALNWGTLNVNSVAVAKMTQFYSSAQRWGRVSALRYFSAGDIVEISLLFSTTYIMQVNAYGSANESPFLHIVRIA